MTRRRRNAISQLRQRETNCCSGLILDERDTGGSESLKKVMAACLFRTLNKLCGSPPPKEQNPPLFQELIWPWKLANAGTPPVRVLIRHHASRHNMGVCAKVVPPQPPEWRERELLVAPLIYKWAPRDQRCHKLLCLGTKHRRRGARRCTLLMLMG